MGANAADGAAVNIQAEVNYYFTFRNPKFGGDVFASTSVAAKQADLRIGAALNNAVVAQMAPQQAEAAAEVADDEDTGQQGLKRPRTSSTLDSTPVVSATQSMDSSGSLAATAAASVLSGEEQILNEETRQG